MYLFLIVMTNWFSLKRAESTELIGGNRMPLTDELDFGNYKVLTVGGLSDKFSALGNGGSGMACGRPLISKSLWL